MLFKSDFILMEYNVLSVQILFPIYLSNSGTCEFLFFFCVGVHDINSILFRITFLLRFADYSGTPALCPDLRAMEKWFICPSAIFLERETSIFSDH